MILASLEKLLLISWFATCVQEVSSLYGYPCDSTQKNSKELCSSYPEICKDFKCQCDSYLHLHYDKAIAECKPSYVRMNWNYKGDQPFGSCMYDCPDDQKCVSMTRCVCKKKNHVRVRDKCMEESIQSPMEKCYISEKAYICNVTASSHCVNGTCACFPNFYYNETAKECLTTFKNLTADSCFMRCRDYQKCADNKCVCKNDNHIEIKNICKEPTIQRPMEKCSIGGEYICNKTQHLHCSGGKCLCLQDYYYNETLKECLTKKSYTDLYGIKDYKALPGGYCTKNGECIIGLNCVSQKCRCPRGCNYKQKDFICDCGAVSFETPTSVILTGIFFGLISVTFWTCVIKRTINTNRKKASIEFVSIPLESESHSVPRPRTPQPSVPVTRPIPAPEPDPVPRSPRGSYQPKHDLPPSYDAAMLSGPSAVPIGFCSSRAENSETPYPLNPISTDTSSNPPPYPFASAPSLKD